MIFVNDLNLTTYWTHVKINSHNALQFGGKRNIMIKPNERARIKESVGTTKIVARFLILLKVIFLIYIL